MVGEEQERTDEDTIIRTARVELGAYGAGTSEDYGAATLPFKRVLAVLAVNMASDTNVAIPIRVVSPNVFRYLGIVAASGDPVTDGGAMGNAEVVCVLPNE